MSPLLFKTKLTLTFTWIGGKGMEFFLGIFSHYEAFIDIFLNFSWNNDWILK